MFLNRLGETTKENFLKVCVHASLSNGVFADEEKDTLFAYCREMMVPESIPETPETFDELVEIISSETSSEEKNIYILEILALIKSDGVYDDMEQKFMEKLAIGLGFNRDVLDRYNILLEKYIEVGRELFDAISE